jgi:hypothetical protein
MSVHNLSDMKPHKAGYALCICGYKCVAVCPVETDDQALECDSCGAMTLSFVSLEAFRRGGGTVTRLARGPDGRMLLIEGAKRPPPLSKEERAKRSPRPPAERVDALHDQVAPTSGRLLWSTPIDTRKR